IKTCYSRWIMLAIVALGVCPKTPKAQAAITVAYHLSNAPASAAANITTAVDAAVAVWNQWSDYNKPVNVYYNVGVPTAQANFDGVITFGAGTQYHNAATAWHEMLHVMGSGTYGAYAGRVSGGNWTGSQGIAMTLQYFPDNALKADNHIHWVGGGSIPPEQELSRQGVHIMGAMRADMGLSNGNRYDLPGDFNDDGLVNSRDLLVFRANLHTDVSALSPLESYQRGDMNLDRQINYADFLAFRDAYAAGRGRAESQQVPIPEPPTACLAAVGLIWLRSIGRGLRPPAKAFLTGTQSTFGVTAPPCLSF
ncbi:MAG TPA: dockerin type I domain-containing protein, partial [Lacipirellula sp.]